jgi:hypothetical protein
MHPGSRWHAPPPAVGATGILVRAPGYRQQPAADDVPITTPRFSSLLASAQSWSTLTSVRGPGGGLCAWARGGIVQSHQTRPGTHDVAAAAAAGVVQGTPACHKTPILTSTSALCCTSCRLLHPAQCCFGEGAGPLALWQMSSQCVALFICIAQCTRGRAQQPGCAPPVARTMSICDFSQVAFTPGRLATALNGPGPSTCLDLLSRCSSPLATPSSRPSPTGCGTGTDLPAWGASRAQSKHCNLFQSMHMAQSCACSAVPAGLSEPNRHFGPDHSLTTPRLDCKPAHSLPSSAGSVCHRIRIPACRRPVLRCGACNTEFGHWVQQGGLQPPKQSRALSIAASVLITPLC